MKVVENQIFIISINIISGTYIFCTRFRSTMYTQLNFVQNGYVPDLPNSLNNNISLATCVIQRFNVGSPHVFPLNILCTESCRRIHRLMHPCSRFGTDALLADKPPSSLRIIWRIIQLHVGAKWVCLLVWRLYPRRSLWPEFYSRVGCLFSSKLHDHINLFSVLVCISSSISYLGY